MVRHLGATHVARVGAALGEGPVWDAKRGELTFVDVVPGRLYRADESGRVETVCEIGRPLGAALPAIGAYRLLVTREGFATLGEGGRITMLLDVLAERPDLRFNDAKCDSAGRCFAGTLSLDGAPGAGALYRLDAGGGPARVHPVLTGVELSNGLDWSPSGDALYFADTLAMTVRRFAYDPAHGRVGAGTLLVDTAPDTPDGLCVDDTGAIWVAYWAGGVVRRYTPQGTLDTVVELPVPNVTSCTFGGARGGTLYITTASAAGPDGTPHPLAGDLFAVEPGVTGPAAYPWRGASDTLTSLSNVDN